MNPDKLVVLRAFGAALLAAPAYGSTLEYGVGVGVGHSDNITRTADNTVSSSIAVAGLQLDLQQQTQRLTASIKSDLQYFNYSTKVYGSEVFGRFDGNAQFGIVPGRLDWIVQDNFGVGQVDRFAADNPANREVVNYFTTGPQLSLRLGQQGFLHLAGRYSLVDYQTSNLDNNRVKGELALGRNLSSASQLSLNATTEKLRFSDSVGDGDYSRHSGYMRYQLKGVRTELGLNLGATRSDQGADGISGPLVQLDVSRQISSAMKLTLSAGSMLTDGSDSFRGQTLASVGQLQTSQSTPSAATFERRYGSVAWDFQRRRISWNVYARYSRDAYESTRALNLSRMEVFGTISRRVTQAATVALFASATRSEYLNDNFIDKYSGVGASLDIRTGSRLHFVATFEHFLRDIADGAPIPASGFHENRGALSVAYRSR